jgi:glycosyltransferase involved in cell wall biosynthesis
MLMLKLKYEVMRVLQVITSLATGGAEKLILDSVPLYEKRRIKVDVMVLNNKETVFSNRLKEVFSGQIIGLSSGSPYNPFLIFKIIPKLRNYDLVHFHLFPTLYWVVLAKLLSCSKVKLIYTEHSTNNRRRESLVFRVVDKIIYKKIDKIVCITGGVKKHLTNHLKIRREISVINNGINNELFKTIFDTSCANLEKSDFKLIQVSSFRKQKDQPTLIRSLVYLPINVKLTLVGDGPLIEENKNLVKELNLETRVEFLGIRYDIPSLMASADVAVLSSHWEGFGLAIVEGMATGKPAIASNIDGIREIVEGYGLLFNKGDEKGLANLVDALMTDVKFYQDTATACFERAKDFDIDTMVNKYIKLYKTVLNA